MKQSFFKIGGLVSLLILLNFGLWACTDQPTDEVLTLPTATPINGLPLPSTPDLSETTEIPIPTPQMAQPGPTPTPEPDATAKPPQLSGNLPQYTPLPNLTSLKTVKTGEFKGQSLTSAGKPEPLRALALSPDHKMLALADRSQIWLIELPSGKLVQAALHVSSATSEDSGAHSLAWSSDGQLLAAGGLTGLISMWHWDKPSNRLRNGPARLVPMQMAEAFGDSVEVAFSPDNRTLAGFGSDGTLTIYNVGTYQPQASFKSDYAGYMSWANDGKRLVDEYLLLHYLEGEHSILPEVDPPISGDGPQGVAWSPVGNLIAVSGDTFELLLLAAPEHTADQPYPALSQTVKRVALRSKVATTMPHIKEGRRVVWSPSGRIVAVANVPEIGKISLWNDSGQFLTTVNTGTSLVRSVIFPMDNLLISAGDDGLAQLWQLNNP